MHMLYQLCIGHRLLATGCPLSGENAKCLVFITHVFYEFGR
jgi:hypothetical protein